jgi:hypothetical protein
MYRRCYIAIGATMFYSNVIFYFFGFKVYSFNIKKEKDYFSECEQIIPTTWGHLEYMYCYTVCILIIAFFYGILSAIADIMKENKKMIKKS